MEYLSNFAHKTTKERIITNLHWLATLLIYDNICTHVDWRDYENKSFRNNDEKNKKGINDNADYQCEDDKKKDLKDEKRDSKEIY